MNKIRHYRAAQLLSGLMMTLAGAAALAQSPDRVEITGSSPVRDDIGRSCPSITAELGDALANKVMMHGEYGVTEVELSIGPQGIAELQTKGGPRVYRSALRRAVRQLDCLDAHTGQRFRFQVAFVSEEDAQANQALAAKPGVLSIAGR